VNASLNQVLNCGYFNVLSVITTGILPSFADDLGTKQWYC